MAFLNQSSCLVTDSYGSIYNFTWTKDGIVLIYHDKILGKIHRSTVIEDAFEEFDVIIDSKDNIYLLCQGKDGKIILKTYSYGTWSEDIISNTHGKKVYNLTMIYHIERIQVIYCMPIDDNKNKYIIYHSFKEKSGWITNDVDNISRLDILNPFKLLRDGKNILLGFYDVVNNCEEIFIKSYNNNNIIWSERVQLTSSGNKKLYLDMLRESSRLHLTYCEYQYGNFIVRYDKFDINEGGFERVKEETLSNPENCSYPTFIIYDNKLWNSWTEFNRVISSFTSDIGDTWEGPFLWKESINNNFTRYKFSSNDKKAKDIYRLENSFGKTYPEISFIGFGPLSDTEKVPIKKKDGGNNEEKEKVVVKDEDIEIKGDNLDSSYDSEFIPRGKIYRNYSDIDNKKEEGNMNNNQLKGDIYNEIENLKKQLRDITHRINYLEEIRGKGDFTNDTNDSYNDRLLKVENKVNDIEEYLVRRRRGPFGR